MKSNSIQIETLTAEIPMEEYLRDYVDVRRFLGLCAQCSNYRNRWSCPPFDFDPLDHLRKFSVVRVVARKILPIADWRPDDCAVQGAADDPAHDHQAGQTAEPGAPDPHAGPTFTGEGAKSYDWVWQMMSSVKADLEAELFEEEKAHPGSELLSGGSCYKCAEGCTRPGGAPCRHPDVLRYSIEALGGDVEKIARDLLGSPLLWAEPGELAPYYMLVGGLMLP